MSNVLIWTPHADANFAAQLSHLFAKSGLEVLLVEEPTRGGSLDESSIMALRESSLALVVLSKSSLSEFWLDDRIAVALAAKQALISLHMDGESRANCIWPLVSIKPSLNAAQSALIDLHHQILALCGGSLHRSNMAKRFTTITAAAEMRPATTEFGDDIAPEVWMTPISATAGDPRMQAALWRAGLMGRAATAGRLHQRESLSEQEFDFISYAGDLLTELASLASTLRLDQLHESLVRAALLAKEAAHLGIEVDSSAVAEGAVEILAKAARTRK